MQWFLVQRVSAAVTGGTIAHYMGPFYGDPELMLPLAGFFSDAVILIYVNGMWTEYVSKMPIVGR